MNGRSIGHDVIGAGEPLLLITGVGCQRVMWPDGLCEAFVARGFSVIRYDHRDVGESSRFEGPPPPPMPWMVARALSGRPSRAPYELTHLAEDAAGLLDALGISSAHVFGASMGGMIAQELALRHPGRVRTLTTMMSSPGGRRYLVAHPRVLRGVLGRAPRTDEEVVRWQVGLFRAIGSPGYPFDEDEHHALARLSVARGHNPLAFDRHLQVVLAARRRPIERIAVPTLVLHGAADPLVPVRGGRATARAIPGARLVTFPGMGHDLPRALWPRFAAEVADLAARAGGR